MRKVVIKDGEKTAYFGCMENPMVEITNKVKPIITHENYIERSGIEYYPERANYPIKIASIHLKNAIEGTYKFERKWL